MASLPPEDSAFWDQIEEEIAAERWPAPSMFRWLGAWSRGASNELQRRAAFRRQLTRRLAATRWWFSLFWGLFAADLLYRFLTEPRARIYYRYFCIAYAIYALTMVVEELTFKRRFDRRYDRYLGRRDLAAATS